MAAWKRKEAPFLRLKLEVPPYDATTGHEEALVREHERMLRRRKSRPPPAECRLLAEKCLKVSRSKSAAEEVKRWANKAAAYAAIAEDE